MQATLERDARFAMIFHLGHIALPGEQIGAIAK